MKNHFLQEMNRKISNFKIQGAKTPCPSDAHELNQIRHVRSSHKHQLLQGWQFPHTMGIQTHQPKIPV